MKSKFPIGLSLLLIIGQFFALSGLLDAQGQSDKDTSDTVVEVRCELVETNLEFLIVNASDFDILIERD
jgi:hypothetical protein